MQIDFATCGRILFGSGKATELPQLVQGMGQRAFIARSKSHPFAQQICALLRTIHIEAVEYTVQGEPSIDSVKSALDQARAAQCDLVIGIGGGSVIDTGKAVAAMLANPGDLMDYLEVVGLGKKISNRSKPYVAIPTTAGTGSEVTRNAVIAVPEKRVKVSMRSATMLPDVALIDPELTFSMSPALTASTGMDAFIQVIEPYVSNGANAIVDMFCRDAIPRAARNLFKAYQDGQDRTAREQMAWVSLMGGLSLANARLGAAHGFAGPIGGMFDAPHGTICAAVMPAVMSVNIRALTERASESEAIKRYAEIAEWMIGSAAAEAEESAEWMKQICRDLKIPRLADLGINRSDFEQIVEKASHSSSMKGNPVQLTREEMIEILDLSY
jgi:alcohol dehydrogenase class IV